MDKINLLSFSSDELKTFFTDNGEKAFRATQVMKWIYHQNVTDFDAMLNLSKKTRAWLQEVACIEQPEVVKTQIAKDGVIKFLLKMEADNLVETVYIPEGNRATLCVSSQVGCALDCSFCSTARQGFNRNLTTAEIIGQIFQANNYMENNNLQRVTNVVLMGMGEPLLNYKNVVSALKIMLDDFGFGLSKRRVTISTAGVVPAMIKLADDVDVSLAVSLHSATDELRSELVPLNKKYPIAELMKACQHYLDGDDRKKHIMFEYVMLKGVNDQPEHARALVKLLKGMSCKVNLIAFNPFASSGYFSSEEVQVLKFQTILTKAKIRTLLRKQRGEDVDAACGQLAGKVKDKSSRHVKFSSPRFGTITNI